MTKLSEIKKQDMCDRCYWSKKLFPVGSLVKNRIILHNCYLTENKISQKSYLDKIPDHRSRIIRTNSLLLVLNHFHDHHNEENIDIGGFHFLWNGKTYLYYHDCRKVTKDANLNFKFNEKFMLTLSKVLEKV